MWDNLKTLCFLTVHRGKHVGPRSKGRKFEEARETDQGRKYSCTEKRGAVMYVMR